MLSLILKKKKLYLYETFNVIYYQIHYKILKYTITIIITTVTEIKIVICKCFMATMVEVCVTYN